MEDFSSGTAVSSAFCSIAFSFGGLLIELTPTAGGNMSARQYVSIAALQAGSKASLAAGPFPWHSVLGGPTGLDKA